MSKKLVLNLFNSVLPPIVVQLVSTAPSARFEMLSTMLASSFDRPFQWINGCCSHARRLRHRLPIR